ncbi:Abortive infection protein [Lysobacter dokdonensis DS-58]|uniref:Abortive infection protein n=1 Tax=Lysobacter dokdonensis DS-58 TaxID=1300345 RepID=A0A0A2WCU3_9GAMM|nr:CPBP family intramembrane glutamic endopeptidase [Lysobacter dokdonensis]KGQ17931.1 Abortive infection protein [Lysobacter dokdonensis DS-58]
MPTTFDLLYVLLFAIALPLYDTLFSWKAYARRLRESPARARAWLWSTSTVQAWLLVAVGVGYWLYAGRPWSDLNFTMPEGWRLSLATLLVLAYGAYQAYCIFHVRRDPALRERLQAQVAPVADVVPHTRPEVRAFIGVSITAGVCEEFLYRGYFTWALAPWLGWWGAAAFSTLLFALGHAYQGFGGILRTGLFGALYMVTVAVFDSIWPAIALHILVDVSGGVMSWLVLRDAPRAAIAPHNEG